jgi:aminopeptidase N
MVDHFTVLVGPFPYAKLANVQSSTRFGGMENASAIFYSERALASGRDIEGTVSHEIAHQWFGDAVTEAEWHHLWLSEGFATYFGNQFFEAADGAAEFRRRMARAGAEYLESDVVDRPIVDPAEDDLFALLNANNYEKGGWVLHMLRGILGDDAFFRGIREYYRRFANSTALTGDLRDVMEEVSGRELGWFFDQWVLRPGYPVLDVTHTPPDEDGVTTVRIEQVQDPAWPTFRIPLVVEVRAGGGVTRRDVVLEARMEEIRLELAAPIERVVVDPDGWVLKRVVDRPEGGP